MCKGVGVVGISVFIHGMRWASKKMKDCFRVGVCSTYWNHLPFGIYLGDPKNVIFSCVVFGGDATGGRNRKSSTERIDYRAKP